MEENRWSKGKITAKHFEGLAIVYVRQSTMQQIEENQESTRLQYNLVNRAKELGWRKERVEVIDEDLGKSGSSAEGRIGFQRMVGEVGMDHVGIILGIEMSRLARSNRDWHQLLEVCALFGTLIADMDGVYDPKDYNDRLLLGLKGTMSEAELHIIKQRMYQGKLNKAKRGELGFHVPIGYIRRPSGEICLDPDEQAQQVVRLIFKKFEEIRTLAGVLRYLVKNEVQIGVRVQSGMDKGDLEWRRPNRMTLQNVLKHPMYAGAYCYGRRQIDPKRKQAGRPHTGKVVQERRGYHVLIKDKVPAYISWEQFEKNQKQLIANCTTYETTGVVRKGEALLSSLLRCGKCGARMTTHYKEDGKYSYSCNRLAVDYAGKSCQHIVGQVLDKYVSKQVLEALTPVALSLSLAVSEQVEKEREELNKLWEKRMERAEYETDRIKRQYNRVEPENRLVARQLEKEWEEKLRIKQELEEEYKRFLQQQPHALTKEERDDIEQLAKDVPDLWHADTTTSAERKEIIRQLIENIEMKVKGNTEQVDVKITWFGNVETQITVIRPVSRLKQLSYYSQMCERIKELAEKGLRARDIAEILNQEGFNPPRHHESFSRQSIQAIMKHLGLTQKQEHNISKPTLLENQWYILDLAQKIGMPKVTLYNWVRCGWVKAHKHSQSPHYWVIWADSDEIKRLKDKHLEPVGQKAYKIWCQKSSEIL